MIPHDLSRWLDLQSYSGTHGPSIHQPGSFFEQLAAIDIYLADPTRHDDPDGAWLLARRLTMSHVRNALRRGESSK